MSVQRIRTIKPEFFVHEDLAEVTMPGRLLFVGLWTVADRDGRLEDRPRRLKGQLFPHDAVDIDLLLEELAARGFIRRYVVEGHAYIDIPAFLKHQRPNVREPASEIPSCPDVHVHARARTCMHEPPARAQGTGTGTGTGTGSVLSSPDVLPEIVKKPLALVERGPGETKPLPSRKSARAKPKTTWPDDFSLTDELRRYTERNALDAEYQFGKFQTYATANGKTYADWPAAFKYWVRNAWELEQRRSVR